MTKAQRGHYGKLIIIGGHEDKDGEQNILHHVAALVKAESSLVILTVATHQPDETFKEYTQIFTKLGVKKIECLDIRMREDAHNPDQVEKLKHASVVFITGGDQLRITSQIGDTPVFQTMQKRYRQGLTIAGTSAGAAVMPVTMLVSGSSDESGKISAIGMAPGLGFIEGVVIDSHFAERGRIGRLLGAVSQNPANLGLGIDENTAVIFDPDGQFYVVGGGAIYVIDGTEITYSNLSEERPEGVLAMHDVKLHVLGEGDYFDLNQKHPVLKQAAAT